MTIIFYTNNLCLRTSPQDHGLMFRNRLVFAFAAIFAASVLITATAIMQEHETPHWTYEDAEEDGPWVGESWMRPSQLAARA